MYSRKYNNIEVEIIISDQNWSTVWNKVRARNCVYKLHKSSVVTHRYDAQRSYKLC